MNKEELEMFLLDLYNTKEPTLTEKGKQKIIKTIEDLQDRIDKAIEMFDNKNLQKYYSGMSYEFEINNFKEDLLNILKGGK